MRAIILLLITLSSIAGAHPRRPQGMPDLPPDATSMQLWHALNGRGFHSFSVPGAPRTVIDEVSDLGARNMNWLKHMNDSRPAHDKISLTSASSTGGISIEQPSEYSPKIIQERLDKIKADMPAAMKEVLFNGKPFTEQPPVPLDTYIEWGRTTDRLYQTALRWQTMQQYLAYLEQNRQEDVRGIYHFNKMDPAVRARKLADPRAWTADEKTNFSEWLVSLCLNNYLSLATCRADVNGKINGGHSVQPLFDTWKSGAQATWDGFFTIKNRRSDVRVTNPDLLEMPFRDPNDRDIKAFLKDNIEAEWRFGNWVLKMIFSANAAAYVVFRPGVMPHVNGLGGNEITMNSDQPLTEYDAQWTIRHEFGHVLGLPDCYIEFYDSDRQSIVNYQLDIDNLMCSRHGHIQQKHVDELVRVYSTARPRLP